MSVRLILLPIFVHVALVFALLFWNGRPTEKDRQSAWQGSAWQEEVQLPLLFYVLTIVAWQTHFADLLFLLLAWIFVALRVLRSVRNEGRNAGPLFMASAIVLAAMWLIYAARLLLAI
jgi:hypothetical protein